MLENRQSEPRPLNRAFESEAQEGQRQRLAPLFSQSHTYSTYFPRLCPASVRCDTPLSIHTHRTHSVGVQFSSLVIG